LKLAVFSDIHGNYQALQGVLADIAVRGADVIWCGGDLVGYGANPGEVIDEIKARGIPTIMGNYDDGIGYFRIACGCDYPTEEAMVLGQRSIAWTKAHTTDDQKAYLRSLPYRLVRAFEGHQVVLVHGSPDALNEYLFTEVADDVFERHLQTAGADVLIFGHTHKPFHKRLGGRHLVNAGSVGKPKHGNPNATYALLEITTAAVNVTIVEVPYDYAAAAQAIEVTELPHEYAAVLRTGRG
jgi:putative phosphoesterase